MEMRVTLYMKDVYEVLYAEALNTLQGEINP